MGSCLGKLSTERNESHLEDGGDLCRRSPTALPESLSDAVCGPQQQHKGKRGATSLEEIVNQLIRETLCVIGTIVEK